MELGARLRAAAAFVVKGSRVADIGTDHAYLPIYLIRNKLAVQVYACDVNKGPFLAAQRTVQQAELTDCIAVRLGDGLKALQPKEADNVVIAGMGGSTMTEIMQAAPQVAASVKRFIFQPMNDAEQLRGWLINNGWCIIDETLVEEDDRLYELICAEPGDMTAIAAELLAIGPVLWQKRPPLLAKHIGQLLAKSRRAIAGMAASSKARQSERYQQELRRCEELEARLKCL